MASAGAPRAVSDLRGSAPAWIAFLVLAAAAWVATIAQARGMGNGAGTMGLGLPAFLAVWAVMMAAMMFPSVAPVAILWGRSIAGRAAGPRRAWRLGSFAAGYLLAWTAFGALAFVVLDLVGRAVASHPSSGRWIGAAVFAAAGVYQLTPLKDVCLRHCRSPVGALLHYAGFRGPARDLRVGLHHAVFCVGCCWGLMIVLVPVGVMNVAVMVALAAVIALEKMWSRGPLLARAAGVAFLVLAVAVLVAPSLAPALRADTPMPM